MIVSQPPQAKRRQISLLALCASRDQPVTIKIGNASVQDSTRENLPGL